MSFETGNIIEEAFDIEKIDAMIAEGRKVGYINIEGLPKKLWLFLRQRTGIGASEVAAMMGLTPQYRSSYDVWIDKTADVPTELPDNGALKRGRKLEPITADEYAEETGRTLIVDPFIRIYLPYPCVFASLDRIIEDNGDGRGRGVLEVKTVTSQAFKYWESEIPTAYYLQVQQQLAVMGYSWGDIVVKNIDTWENTIIRFERDEDIISKIIGEIETFWNCYVVPKIEPPMISADFAHVFRKDELPIQTTDDITKLIELASGYELKEKEAESMKDSIKDQIKEYMGERNVLVDMDGKTVLATWKTQTKQACMVNESTFRVLRFKKPKTEKK